MKKKKRIAVLVAIALAVPGVGNWDRQAADAMTADTAQSPVADITESANQAELYHKVYKENTAGHISYSLQDDTGNTLSRYTSSAAAKNKRSMALPASYDPRGTEQETPIRNLKLSLIAGYKLQIIMVTLEDYKDSDTEYIKMPISKVKLDDIMVKYLN